MSLVPGKCTIITDKWHGCWKKKNDNAERQLLKYIINITLLTVIVFMMGCDDSTEPAGPSPTDTVQPVLHADTLKNEIKAAPFASTDSIVTGLVDPNELVSFSRTLIGTPYLYASTDPTKGFDCSGFINYVFTHFNIHVPRSSIDFTDKGREVGLEKALPGDLILFTGTDSAEKFVGHMGLVESRKNDSLYFIHSTSGKAHGVVITSFGKYYASRFVKVIRIFPDEVIQKSAGIERKDSSVLTQ